MPSLQTKKTLIITILFPLLAIYLLSAHYRYPAHIDPTTNATTAWHLAKSGSPYLPAYAPYTTAKYFGETGWLVDGASGPVSLYPPGASLHAAPLYLFVSRELPSANSSIGEVRTEDGYPLPPLWPATITASLATATAMFFLGLIALKLDFSHKGAAYSGLIAGLGTGAWSVASDQLWQHGPAMLWILVAILSLYKGRSFYSGIFFGLALITRPVTIIIPLTIVGLYFFRSKLRRHALGVTLGFIPLFLTLIAYNYYIFGIASISGGYGDRFSNNIIYGSASWYLTNVALGLFDLDRGIFTCSPFILLLVLYAPRILPRVDWITISSGLGGALYILASWRVEDFNGGAGFFSYRYPLEGLAALSPLFLKIYNETIEPLMIRKVVFWILAGLSVGVHGWWAF